MLMTREEKIDLIADNIAGDSRLAGLAKPLISFVVHFALSSDRIPEWVIDAMLTTSDGLDDSEVEVLKKVVTYQIHQVLISQKWSRLIPDGVEYVAVELVVGVIFDYCRKGSAVAAA